MTVRHLLVVGLSGLLCVAVNPPVHATNDHDKHDVSVGTFVDRNPDVSCAEFNPGGSMH